VPVALYICVCCLRYMTKELFRLEQGQLLPRQPSQQHVLYCAQPRMPTNTFASICPPAPLSPAQLRTHFIPCTHRNMLFWHRLGCCRQTVPPPSSPIPSPFPPTHTCARAPLTHTRTHTHVRTHIHINTCNKTIRTKIKSSRGRHHQVDKVSAAQD